MKLFSIQVVFFVTSFVAPASAAVITYNTMAAGGHGFYNGTGGVDGGFTTNTSTEVGLQMSLRGAERYVGPLSTTGMLNDYQCFEGMQCNVDWSIEADMLSNFSFMLQINSITNGQSVSFDPTHPLLGGSYWDPNQGEVMVAGPNNTGNQNSEYFGFSFIATPLGGWIPTNELLIRLVATEVETQENYLSEIWINRSSPEIPEPGTSLLIGIGLGAIALLKRRR